MQEVIFEMRIVLNINKMQPMIRKNRLTQNSTDSNQLFKWKSTEGIQLNHGIVANDNKESVRNEKHFKRIDSKDEVPVPSNSLNTKLKRKTFNERQERKNRLLKIAPNNQRNHATEDYYAIETQIASTPNLKNPAEYFLKHLRLDQRDEYSDSTEESKQSEYQLENMIPNIKNKEVKFHQQIEQHDPKDFNKKPIDKSKNRSPSILKNGKNLLNKSLLASDRSFSIANSTTSKKEKKEKENQTENGNKAIKQKYKNIIINLEAKCDSFQKQLINPRNNRFSAVCYQSKSPQDNLSFDKTKVKSSEKYQDALFPPVHSSLFQTKKAKEKKIEEITWMRLSKLYQHKKMVLAQPKQCEINAYRHKQSLCGQFLAGSLNCIKNNQRTLEKMFENQKVNAFGAYIIKIFQENNWKYVIVDDYIPVFKSKMDQTFKPAFVDVKTHTEGVIDIWPFLVEKAYANYYSSYEALQQGNIVDFVQELTGFPLEKVAFKKVVQGNQSKNNQKQFESEESDCNFQQKLLREMKNGETMSFGYLSEKHPYFPLYYNPEYCNKQLHQETIACYDPNNQYQESLLKFSDLKNIFNLVYIVNPRKYTCLKTTALKKMKRSDPKGSIKEFRNKIFEAEAPSLRYFKLGSSSECAVTIKQKQKRFFHFNENYNNYFWNRVILLHKEYDGEGFRWINGRYSSEKSITFSNYLEAGQYYLVIMPEWKRNINSEINILLYSNTTCSLERRQYVHESKIVERGCMDLAQRLGQLHQINKNICSYNFISERMGFIIENVINERITGSVAVLRSISGLKCKVEIVPFNSQFYTDTMIEGEKMLKLHEEIELDIPKGGNYTVILQMKGGIDSKFFKTFDFGC